MAMRKVFKLEDLDCANCAAKMEDAIKKISGVNSASMSFMTQKLVVDCDPENLDAIMDEAEKICKKIEPDMTILR
jgi:cation transport ATPase